MYSILTDIFLVLTSCMKCFICFIVNRQPGLAEALSVKLPKPDVPTGELKRYAEILEFKGHNQGEK